MPRLAWPRSSTHVSSQQPAPSPRGDWGRLFIASAARVLLFTVLGGLFWAALPAAWGWTPTTVVSDSMAPGIRAGDVVVSMPIADPLSSVGRVLLVEDPDHAERLRLHRLVEVTPDGMLRLQGDANAQADSSLVSPDAVRGVAVLRSPFVGLPFVWVTQGQWALVGATAATLIGLALLSSIDGYLRHVKINDGRPRFRQARRSTIMLLGGTVAVSFAAVLATSAHAAFAAQATNAPNTYAAQSAFDCFTSTPADSPFFAYRFSEASGTTTTDLSGNARTGTLGSGAARGTGNCATNPYLTLTGTTGSYVAPAMTGVTNPGTFSLELWVSTTSTTGGRLIGFGNTATGTSTNYDRHIFLSNSGQFYFGVYPNAVVTINSPLTYRDGLWHHVVATMSPTAGMRLYVDGAQVASNTSTLTAQNYTGFWRVGYDNLNSWGAATPTTHFLTGNIDSAAVYTTVLTAAQVSAHFAAGR